MTSSSTKNVFVLVTLSALLVGVSQVQALRATEVQKASDGIKQRPDFKNVHDLIDKYLKSLIPLTDITILIPANIFVLRNYNSDQQTAILSFNTITTRYLYRNLTDLPGGTLLDTLEGTQVTKRGPNFQPFVAFKGPAALPTVLAVPNLWVRQSHLRYRATDVDDSGVREVLHIEAVLLDGPRNCAGDAMRLVDSEDECVAITAGMHSINRLHKVREHLRPKQQTSRAVGTEKCAVRIIRTTRSMY
ncbi:unnamed protein product [Closterium sp. Naga37s-1]|nr:unnamed protein product [Closterium sp. Naga37s-1]